MNNDYTMNQPQDLIIHLIAPKQLNPSKWSIMTGKIEDTSQICSQRLVAWGFDEQSSSTMMTGRNKDCWNKSCGGDNKRQDCWTAVTLLCHAQTAEYGGKNVYSQHFPPIYKQLPALYASIQPVKKKTFYDDMEGSPFTQVLYCPLYYIFVLHCQFL